jgi:hypothetical protein
VEHPLNVVPVNENEELVDVDRVQAERQNGVKNNKTRPSNMECDLSKVIVDQIPQIGDKPFT